VSGWDADWIQLRELASAFRSQNFPVFTRTFQQIAGYLKSISVQQNFVDLYGRDKPSLLVCLIQPNKPDGPNRAGF